MARDDEKGDGRAPGLVSRLLLGALAGLVGTAAMTAGMRRMHQGLPAHERYPLPPREVTERILGSGHEDRLRDVTLAAHFAYGAALGALLAAAAPRLSKDGGAASGVAVWIASYLGWIPALDLLDPADRHPPRRNALMVAAHLLWGTITAAALNEITAARGTILTGGRLGDAPRPSGTSGLPAQQWRHE